MLTKGQRVNTPYGTARVVGFEQFCTRTGIAMELANEDIRGSQDRIVVDLEQPSLFAGKGTPFMARKDVEVFA